EYSRLSSEIASINKILVSTKRKSSDNILEYIMDNAVNLVDQIKQIYEFSTTVDPSSNPALQECFKIVFNVVPHLLDRKKPTLSEVVEEMLLYCKNMDLL
ncbi:MAG: hypothetical protein MHPSP_003839, partial [Paramarteilia canceri]